GLLGHHQAAARHHCVGRRRGGARDRAQRQDRSGTYDDRWTGDRPPCRRRRARRVTSGRVQDVDRESSDDGSVSLAAWVARLKTVLSEDVDGDGTSVSSKSAHVPYVRRPETRRQARRFLQEKAAWLTPPSTSSSSVPGPAATSPRSARHNSVFLPRS